VPDDIRVGLIGYGLAGQFFHAPIIESVPGLRLAAIVTSDPGRAEAASRAHRTAHVVRSVDALLAMRESLDLVVVATPNRTHVPLAWQALEAGIAVMVDKPLAPTPTEARGLIELAERRSRLLTVYHNRRWDGDFLTLRRLIEEGRLGVVHRFESRFERWRPVPKAGWRQDADPASAGGLLYDLGSHLIDQALVLFGPAAEVYAEMEARTGGQVDDDVFVAVRHESGVRSHLWMSSLAGQMGPRLRVLGSRAAFVKHAGDVQEGALRRHESPGRESWGEEPRDAWGVLGAGNTVEAVPTVPGAYPELYRLTAEAVRRGGPPPVDPRDALAGLEVIEAAQRSAAERRVVTLGSAP
jgi:predicted dehydrogenase